MAQPGFSAEAALGRRSPFLNLRLEVRQINREDKIVPQGCSFWEWLSCAGAIAGCAIECTYRGSECFDCFKRAGKEQCLSCI
jgi:hypothetical protein